LNEQEERTPVSLSAEQFKSIIQGLKSDRPGHGSFEKRANPRVGLRAKITVYQGGDTTKPREVWVRDLSSSGIGIVHTEPIQAGTDFLVCFPLRATDHLWVFYRVMHCRSISPKLYFTGAKLKYIEERRAH
jgi:hypothetical protein